jgi:hypothetical protein
MYAFAFRVVPYLQALDQRFLLLTPTLHATRCVSRCAWFYLVAYFVHYRKLKMEDALDLEVSILRTLVLK